MLLLLINNQKSVGRNQKTEIRKQKIPKAQ